MENFIYCAPTKVIFGKDSIEKLGSELKAFNASKVMIIYGSNRIEKNGLLAKVIDILKTEGIEYCTFSGIKANPTVEYAEIGVEQCKKDKADFLLAIGGGSVIDTAKAISVGAINNVDLWSTWCGKQTFDKVLPIASILTIPAAGSEMSNSSVLTNEKLEQKRGLSSEKYRCKFTIMDPTYAMTLPKKQIACGVVDIMMHTLDRYFYPKQNQHNHMTDAIAYALLKNVIKYGKIAYDTPDDYEAMSEVMWASSLSHNDLTGLGGGRDFSVHQFGHEISAMFDITHGESLSAVWGSWCRYVMSKDVDRFVEFANMVWDISGDGMDCALAGIARTEEFFKSLDMPISIPELSCGSLDESTIISLGEKCTRQDERKIGVFDPLDTKSVIEVYRMANKIAK